MKTGPVRITALLLALLIILSIFSLSFAETESFSAIVVSAKMKVCRDASLKTKWGYLPKDTVVTVKAYRKGVAQIEYSGRVGYAAVSDMRTVASVAQAAYVSQNSRFFKAPSVTSAYTEIAKGTPVYVLAVSGSCARVELNGKVGYMYTRHLIDASWIMPLDEEEIVAPAAPAEELTAAPVPQKTSMSFEEAVASGKYSNEQICFAFLVKKMGLNTAAACGVLANIEAESNFKPTCLGDSGRSLGICQWFASRNTRMCNWCAENGYDKNSLIGQLYFLNYELPKFYPSVWKYLKNAEDSADGAYDAAYYFCFNFEAPANRAARSASRAAKAEGTYYPRYKDVTI